MDPQQIAEVLQELLARGFGLPITWAAVAANGSVLTGRYTEGEDGLAAEVFSEHIEGEVLAVPINFMFVDPSGEAARVVIDREGVVFN